MRIYKHILSIFILILIIIDCTKGQNIQISKGILLNLHNRQPIEGASISTEDGKYNVLTNQYGGFVIATPTGKKLIISSVGFHSILHEPITDTLHHIIFLRPIYTSESDVTVVGTRGRPRTDINSPVPIDIISSKELLNTGQIDLAQMAQFTSPSFVSVKTGLNGVANYADPASLKGLSPDQTLVLVNGKRRHQFSAINNTLVPGRGSVVTDLNAIPALALERMEILKDGAAAQYGSDAIAGVINLVLKKNHVGGLFKTDVGITHKGDGLTLATSINHGFSLGKKGGYLNITLSAQSIQGTDRSDPYLGRFYSDNKTTDDSIRNARGVWPTDKPAYVMKYGSNATKGFQSFVNMGVPLKNNWNWYAFGGTSRKNVTGESFFRTAKPNDPNGSALYPDGYTPVLPGKTADYSIFTGIENHSTHGWKIDLGTGYGYNNLDIYSLESANASKGLESITDFYIGRTSFAQSLTELDFSKTIKKTGTIKWINLAFGTVLKYDEFKLIDGDPASYEIGPLAQSQGKVPGSSGRPGISPDDRTTKSRINSGSYVDVEADINDKLFVSAATRYEYYNDFGGTLTGKVAALWKVFNNVSLRGSINRGFRAPSLQQIYNGQTTTNAQNGLIRQTKQLSANDPRLSAIGIPQPKPEMSWNYSIGLTGKAGKNFIFTLDAYQIDVNDRIIISEILQVGPSIPILQTVFPASTGIKEIAFFTNHVDTRTHGIDLVLSYKSNLTSSKKLSLSGAFSFNKTVINNEKAPPALLQNGALIPVRLIDTLSAGVIKTGLPQQKIIGSIEYTTNKLNLTLRMTYFGKVTAWEKPPGLPHRSQTFGGRTLTDLLGSYKITSKLQITLGANNLFSVYPDKVNPNFATYNNGQVPYSRSGLQFGFNGRYTYLSAQLRL
jgi:iron complex outermembrane receptor protein